MTTCSVSVAPGALSFNDPRDFENPGDGDTNNTYKVIVVASDDAPNIGTPTRSPQTIREECSPSLLPTWQSEEASP